jgi:carboxymethylenebutenolidase
MGKFVTDVAAIRRRARQHMERGAVTENYQADAGEVVKVLNEALATEIVCVLRYKRHYYVASGIDAAPVAAEFLQHATEEQQHGDWIAERIVQLGGEPNFNPEGISERAHSEFDAKGETLVEMIREDLYAERIAIETYGDIIRWLENNDPTTRRMIEEILKMEEEHADDLANLLATLSPDRKPKQARPKSAPKTAAPKAARKGPARKTSGRSGPQRRGRTARAVIATAFLGMALALAGRAAAATDSPPDTPEKEAGSEKLTTPQAEPTPITGPLSEEQFKALHTLKEGAAPPPCGTTVDLAGTRAYLSLPPNQKAPYPGIIVIHEWWGLNNHIQHYSDRLAAEGYAALAVDLYGGKIATSPDTALAYVKAVDPAAALRIMQAADLFLTQDTRVRAPKRGAIGWCFGGGMALQLALKAPDLSAVVMYYGQPVMDPAELKAIKAPLLGIFGNLDGSIPPKTVNEFEKALKDAGVKHEILRYDAEHAFANPSNPHYDLVHAAEAWERVRSFLARELKSGK